MRNGNRLVPQFPGQAVPVAAAYIHIEQDPKTGNFNLTHNFLDVAAVISVISLMSKTLADTLIKANSMIINPNNARPAIPEQPEPQEQKTEGVQNGGA